MECLYCGDCCLRFSPLGSPCPKLIQDGTFFFCGNYQNRPEQCENHRFNGFKVCPIGLGKLELSTATEVSIRIDTGWKKIAGDFWANYQNVKDMIEFYEGNAVYTLDCLHRSGCLCSICTSTKTV
jgi:hypothetical protein